MKSSERGRARSGRTMDRSAGLVSPNAVRRVAVVMILLQLAGATGASAGISPGAHHHHPYGYEYPARWTKHGHRHRRPVDVMTDVVNDLGVKILERYTEHSGNVAFSPSGVGFVLVALYEGSAGTSSRQIMDVLGLPNDRRVTRIGLRDIHRRLRSYLNADAFLGGLTLNRDDINLRPEYEDVLRFYGFDVSDSGNTTAIAAMAGPDPTAATLTVGGTPGSTQDGMQTATQAPIPNPTTINDAVEIITTTTGGPALTVDSTNGLTSTDSVATTGDAMSQPISVMNSASMNVTADGTTSGIVVNTASSPTMPMVTSTTMGVSSATTIASMMIMSIVQAIMNTMNASSTAIPMQTFLGPPTVAADMLTQSSDGSTVSLGAPDSNLATSPMTPVATTSMSPAVGDSMLQRLVGASVGGVTDMRTAGSDRSTSMITNIVRTTSSMMTLASGSTTSPTTVTIADTVNSTDGPTTAVTETSTTNTTKNFVTIPTSSATDPPTNPTTSSLTNGPPPPNFSRSFSSESMEAEIGSSQETLMTTMSTIASTVTTARLTTIPSTVTTASLTTIPSTVTTESLTNVPSTTITIPDTTTDSDYSGETTTDITTTNQEDTMTTTMNDAMTNAVRRRRSVLQGPAGYFSSSADDGIWLDVYGRFTSSDDYQTQDEDIVEDSNPTTQLDFLVNGCDYSRVTAATYTAILPFAYFHSLRMSLLEFPLDDPRYKILVMLPGEANGTKRLARILTTKSITLRHLRRSLRPTWVTAVIPSFMLRGFVTLTPYLQRLGISDVFEPRIADLSPMSPDLGVYARDIQQSIGVNIRNNRKGGIGGADGGNGDAPLPANLVRGKRGVVGLPPFFDGRGPISPRSFDHLHYSPYPGGAGPIPFVVDRPFLYFIIDDQTSVTLLAGRIDDPLNSRIML